MAPDGTTLLLELGDLYSVEGDDVDLDDFLRSRHVTDDDLLADVIESDGRHRIGKGRAVGLDRYFKAIPDLRERQDPLDAAIDVTLRWLSRDGGPDQALETLVETHPELETAIREAAALGNAIWSTNRLRRNVGRPRARELPMEFGPPTPDGLPRYELQRLLGAGAFGQVYLAVDRQLSEDDHHAMVAVKVLDRSLLDEPEEGPWLRRRITDEATKARRIDHPNVVRVLDRGISADDEDFIVYEYVDGGDLDGWIEHGGDLKETVELAARISRGVQAAHAAGLVHCDLKPGNVMMTGAGIPKVADFGVAVREEERDRRQKEHEDRPIGNVAFISPEQFRCEPGSLSVASDVYALGGMLFLLLTGELPNGRSFTEITKTHDLETGRSAAPPIEPRRKGVDDDLEAICRRAMSPMSAERHPSAGQLADDLDAWLRREPIPWTQPPMSRRLKLWILRRPAIAILMLLLIASVVTGEIAWRRHASAAASAQARADAEIEWREEKTQLLRNLRDKMTSTMVDDRAISAEMMAGLWVMEFISGNKLFDIEGEHDAIWATRVEYIERHTGTARAEGRGEHIETLLWQTALSLWYIRDGRYDEADAMLLRTRVSMDTKLEVGDVWLENIAILERVSHARRTLDAWPAQREELSARIDELARDSSGLDQRAPRSPLDRLVLDVLLQACDAQHLDQRVRYDTAYARLKAIRDNM